MTDDLDYRNAQALETYDRLAENGPEKPDGDHWPEPYDEDEAEDERHRREAEPELCQCGKELDEGEHDGGYGAWCG